MPRRDAKSARAVTVLLLLAGGLTMVVLGLTFSVRERRAARRGRRRPRPDYLSSCALLMVLGAVAAALSIPVLLGP